VKISIGGSGRVRAGDGDGAGLLTAGLLTAGLVTSSAMNRDERAMIVSICVAAGAKSDSSIGV